jgi:hypothetical protein
MKKPDLPRYKDYLTYWRLERFKKKDLEPSLPSLITKLKGTQYFLENNFENLPPYIMYPNSYIEYPNLLEQKKSDVRTNIHDYCERWWLDVKRFRGFLKRNKDSISYEIYDKGWLALPIDVNPYYAFVYIPTIIFEEESRLAELFFSFYPTIKRRILFSNDDKIKDLLCVDELVKLMYNTKSMTAKRFLDKVISPLRGENFFDAKSYYVINSEEGTMKVYIEKNILNATRFKEVAGYKHNTKNIARMLAL